jgi:hypothetical protein
MKSFLVWYAIGWERLSVSFTMVPRCLLRLALLLPVLASAQEHRCDPSLNAPAGHPYGYRLRGDRCEGIYVKEVGGTTLLVASLTESFEEHDLTSNHNLLVEWTAPEAGEVRLRTYSLRRKLYYRMDTVRPPGSTSYPWPLSMLAALNIPKRDIGVVGWTQYTVGKTERSVYVPLRISQQRQPLRSGHYQLVLLPSRELTEVFVTLAAVGADGDPAAFLQDGTALGYGFYPAERGITIPLANLQMPGIYYLELGATLQGGGVTTVALWFYHASK